MPALEIRVLAPLMTKSSPSRSARVRIAATSDPASGSVMANAAILCPSRTAGRYAAFSSSLPASVIAPVPRPCIAKATSAMPER